MAINAAFARRFQRNLMRKIAADGPFKPIPPEPIPPGYTLDKGGKLTPTLEHTLSLNDPIAIQKRGPLEQARILQQYNDITQSHYSEKLGKRIKNVGPDAIEESRLITQEQLARYERIKQKLLDYAPAVGGGAALGALLGGGIGYGTTKDKLGGSLLGGILGGIGGAGAGGLGRYLYDRYKNRDNAVG